jgi:dihydrodipicolinate reductase
MTYFAMDGDYGFAHGLVVIDTSGWTEKDWDRIENATDDDRIVVALNIAMGD